MLLNILYRFVVFVSKFVVKTIMIDAQKNSATAFK